MTHPLVWPMIIQMALTLAVLFWLAYNRLTYISKHGMAEVQKKGFPLHIDNASNNFKHQFETPVLFYALCLLIMAHGTTTDLIIWAAWAFVIGRIIHAFIQLGKNIIFPWRFLVFLATVFALLVMLIAFACQNIG